MSTKSIEQTSSLTANRPSKKSYLLAFALSSSSLLTVLLPTAFVATGLTAASTMTQAAGLGDLFGKEQGGAKSEFLPVAQAFQVSSSSNTVKSGTRLAINFDITPGHYVYKDQIKLTLPAGVSAAPFSFSQSSISIDDPTFGQVPVFDQANMVATTLLTNNSGKSLNNAAVVIGWQGCAKAGLCYPPEKIKTTVNIAATGEIGADNAAADITTPNLADASSLESEADNAKVGSVADDDVVDYALMDDVALEGELAATSTISGADSEVTSSSTTNNAATNNATLASQNAVDGDPFGLASHPWLALVLLFLAGLGLALTPCVLPMLPIVANIVAREENPTVKRGVILTTSYAIGVAIAYGILGALIAVFGESLGIIGWLQNPIILISFAIIFVLLALYMLGVFSIRLPRAISNKMQGLSQAGDSKLGSAGGSLLAGFLSALVVSPCVSAPLFGALLAVSTIGNPLLGFAALFMLGFGLSAPLILIGATQGKIMPKAGEWMNWVKIGFALLLFAVALLLIERVFISPVMLMVWALWFMVVATWAWSWLGKGRLLTQALGLVVGIWAVCLIVGAALGNDDSLHPLASLSAAPMVQLTSGQPSINNGAADKNITTLAELDSIIAENPKVIVDLTADWCVECRIMDKNLFHNRPAQMQDWQLVKLDITETTEDSKAVLARYKLFGPPALLYYRDGQFVQQQVGEIARTDFEQTLTSLN
ncbi:protein-disulfide reductase DsbD [Psychrobacter alimentarius]|uniref:protein-disulfide reductase DsbD n=1 Tax=Psychrobacter alimentarius TaxID=261164 RepID=UPI003FD5392A